MSKIQSGQKVGVGKYDFALRLLDRPQIGIFNIATVTDVVAYQKSRLHEPLGSAEGV
jgi:hypothetical protein